MSNTDDIDTRLRQALEDRAKDLYQSALKVHYGGVSPQHVLKHNQEVLESNRSKKSTSIISNLYRIDERSKPATISSLFSHQIPACQIAATAEAHGHSEGAGPLKDE